MTKPTLNPNSPFFHEERHTTLQAISDTPILICGVGALGGNLAETLARMGFSRLYLLDKDRVEMRNLSTQPYSRAEVGTPKARALANSLYRAVQAKIEPVVAELTATNATTLLKEAKLVVDAFDNREARQAVSQASNTLQIPCLHIGFSPDGLYASGLWEPGYIVPESIPGDPCDYPLTRPLAITVAALAARSICDFLRSGTATDFEFTWNDAKISFLG